MVKTTRLEARKLAVKTTRNHTHMYTRQKIIAKKMYNVTVKVT